MIDEVLPEFHQFLISRKLASPKNVPFYAYWVSKFLAFSNKHLRGAQKDRVCSYLKNLRFEKTEDWKIEQAESAIKIYRENFLNSKNVTITSSGEDTGSERPRIISKIESSVVLLRQLTEIPLSSNCKRKN